LVDGRRRQYSSEEARQFGASEILDDPGPRHEECRCKVVTPSLNNSMRDCSIMFIGYGPSALQDPMSKLMGNSIASSRQRICRPDEDLGPLRSQVDEIALSFQVLLRNLQTRPQGCHTVQIHRRTTLTGTRK
jgi:hypothetical protein